MDANKAKDRSGLVPGSAFFIIYEFMRLAEYAKRLPGSPGSLEKSREFAYFVLTTGSQMPIMAVRDPELHDVLRYLGERYLSSSASELVAHRGVPVLEKLIGW